MRNLVSVLCIAVCLSFFGSSAQAQMIIRAAKGWSKSLGKKVIPQETVPYMVRQMPLQEAQRIIDLQKKTFSSPEKLEESLEYSLQDFRLSYLEYMLFSRANDARVKASKKLLRQQINWFLRDKEKILQSLEIYPAQLHVDYKKLIDPSARVIFLGEMHGVGNVRRQVLSAVAQYQQAYPGKRIYLLTEFMEAEYPGESRQGFYRNVYLRGKYVEPEQMGLLHRLASSGVKVRGLEPIKGLKELADNTLVNDPDFKAGSVSLIGQYIRNRSWVHTIRQFMQKDPDAVFFIYTGLSHCSYKYLESLPVLLKEPRSQVIIFSVWWEDLFNPAFEKMFSASFLVNPQAKAVTVLKNPLYRRLFGADVMVNVHK